MWKSVLRQLSSKKVAVPLLVISGIGAIALTFFGQSTPAKVVGAPAALLLGWAALGHLVTADDEVPGEWGNPDGSRRIFYSSLLELLLKTFLLAGLVICVYA